MPPAPCLALSRVPSFPSWRPVTGPIATALLARGQWGSGVKQDGPQRPKGPTRGVAGGLSGVP